MELDPFSVMPALIAGIHVLAAFPKGISQRKTWMAGT
jgi:hypothetical protein